MHVKKCFPLAAPKNLPLFLFHLKAGMIFLNRMFAVEFGGNAGEPCGSMTVFAQKVSQYILRATVIALSSECHFHETEVQRWDCDHCEGTYEKVHEVYHIYREKKTGEVAVFASDFWRFYEDFETCNLGWRRCTSTSIVNWSKDFRRLQNEFFRTECCRRGIDGPCFTSMTECVRAAGWLVDRAFDNKKNYCKLPESPKYQRISAYPTIRNFDVNTQAMLRLLVNLSTRQHAYGFMLHEQQCVRMTPFVNDYLTKILYSYQDETTENIRALLDYICENAPSHKWGLFSEDLSHVPRTAYYRSEIDKKDDTKEYFNQEHLLNRFRVFQRKFRQFSLDYPRGSDGAEFNLNDALDGQSPTGKRADNDDRDVKRRKQ